MQNCTTNSKFAPLKILDNPLTSSSYGTFSSTNRRDQARRSDQSKTAAGSLLGTVGNSVRSEAENRRQSALELTRKHVLSMVRKAGLMLPDEQIAHCQHDMLPEAAYVSAQVNPVWNHAHFRGLQTCESSSCPHCAAMKAQEAREYLSAGLASAKVLGLFPVMVTLTARHKKGDRLIDLRRAMSAAMRDFWKDSFGRKFEADYGGHPYVRAWESTYGFHGWHPHMHMILFLDSEIVGVSLARLQRELAERWKALIRKQGFSTSLEYGVDVRSAESEIADYIAKFGRQPIRNDSWGADSELARSHMKTASFDGLTPFELLAISAGLIPPDPLMAIEDCDAQQAIELAGYLYVEYFYAMKGVPRIYWSQGTAELLDLETWVTEIIEQEAAQADPDDEPIPVVLFDRDEWHAIRKQAGLSGLLLECIERATAARDPALLEALMRARGIRGAIADVWRDWCANKQMSEIVF